VAEDVHRGCHGGSLLHGCYMVGLWQRLLARADVAMGKNGGP
jgi:hypothetical protein